MTIRYHSGSALPEYVVPLVLLATATLISLPASGQLNSWFKNSLSQTTGGQVQNGSLIINSGQTCNQNSTSGSQSEQNPSSIPQNTPNQPGQGISPTKPSSTELKPPPFISINQPIVEVIGSSGCSPKVSIRP